MPRPESEENYVAPPPPGFTTLTKAFHNDWAGNAEQDAERMETESHADVEKQFDESTGKLTWKMFSTFGCNGSIQAYLFSTTVTFFLCLCFVCNDDIFFWQIICS